MSGSLESGVTTFKLESISGSGVARSSAVPYCNWSGPGVAGFLIVTGRGIVDGVVVVVIARSPDENVK